MKIEGDTYKDRSFAVLTPTRASIHIDAYCAHMAMDYPMNVSKVHVVATGHTVDRAYNELFRAALSHKYAYALTLEDDMLPEIDSLCRLFDTVEKHPEFAGVSALYRTKDVYTRPLIFGHPDNVDDFSVRAPINGDVMEVNAVPMGFAIWRLSMFREMPFPWFQVTRDTQDIYFARQARKRGYRFAVDCSNRVGHLDVNTGKVY